VYKDLKVATRQAGAVRLPFVAMNHDGSVG
jgi:hypothetical protein